MKRTGMGLLALYERQLKTLGYRFVGRFQTIKSRAPLYILVFASKSPRGKDFWEKVCAIAPSGQREMF